MFRRANWDKLPKCIFENFEIAWVKRRWFIPKIAQTKHVVAGYHIKAKKHFVLKVISINSGELQISKRAITKLMVQSWLQSVVWLTYKFYALCFPFFGQPFLWKNGFNENLWAWERAGTLKLIIAEKSIDKPSQPH